MSHVCHAVGCSARVPPTKLMCLEHWRMVPKSIQMSVNRGYRPGQCADKTPSREWLKAARSAINWVRNAEQTSHVYCGANMGGEGACTETPPCPRHDPRSTGQGDE